MKNLILNRTLALGIMLVSNVSGFASQAAEIASTDFAYGMPLSMATDAAIHTLAVPVEVYRHSAQAGLGDVRIFNSEGEAVPYFISTPVQTSTRESLVSVPIFPLRGDPVRAMDSLKITIDAGERAVNLQSDARASQPAPVPSYVIDARSLNKPLAALELQWPDTGGDFSGQLNIEASDDLHNWRLLTSAQPIVSLTSGVQHLVQNRVEFAATKFKFLRLTWQGPPIPLILNNALLEPAPTNTVVARSEVAAIGRAVADKAEYEFVFDISAPMDRVNIKLPEINTVAQVVLSSRQQSVDPWHEVVSMTLYEFVNDGKRIRNPAAMIASNHDRWWRMQLSKGSIGKAAPMLELAWIPQQITFLARGHSPFQLAFGSAAMVSASLPLTELLRAPDTMQVGTATVGAMKLLGGPERMIAKHPLPWRQWLLWVILTIAVVVLGWAAYRLARDMSKEKHQG